MSRLHTHPESHLVSRIGWLRAAVLGANDGIVSTASLIVGVAEVLVAGVAGLVAGAMSMAAGEYVSVSSQADIEGGDLACERAELATQPDFEREELARIYIDRGVSPHPGGAHLGSDLRGGRRDAAGDGDADAPRSAGGRSLSRHSAVSFAPRRDRRSGGRCEPDEGDAAFYLLGRACYGADRRDRCAVRNRGMIASAHGGGPSLMLGVANGRHSA